MKLAPNPEADGYPTADALAALRAWYAGLDARQAVSHYMGSAAVDGQSSRAILTAIRRQLQAYARARRREDFVVLLDHPAEERASRARDVARAIEELRNLVPPVPALSDAISVWLPTRAAQALASAGLTTLGDLVPRMLHRRRWWAAVPGLGATTARQVEQLLSQQPELMRRAGELLVRPAAEIVPWERLQVPLELDGSTGIFRAAPATCTLSARSDIAAISAWLALQEKASTVRSYRKEAERLVLWATLERNKPLSSLTTEDAIAYRAFLRKPAPARRWIGPARPRASAEWRPFQGGLSPRSLAYGLSVINALFRWLKEQNYLLANPFAGLKVKGAAGVKDFDRSHALTRHEWDLVRIEADLLDLRHGWPAEAAWRLRFMLDFWLATGLRPSEFVGATLGNVNRQDLSQSWLHVRGKGDKPALVALPPLATGSLERYLAQRGLPTSPHLWQPTVPLLPSLTEDTEGLTRARVWSILKRFFSLAAEQLRPVNPALAEKLLRATPHWLRHTHATLLLAAGADLKTVRDNLRHANIATTSVYLDADDVQRARELNKAFPGG